MSIIERYALWSAHDAGGTLPPVDVVVAVVRRDAVPAAETLLAGEAYVLVPPQWIGDWDSGFKLAPAYQHLWRVASETLSTLPDPPRSTPYRPDELPPAACGPSPLQRRFTAAPRERRSAR